MNDITDREMTINHSECRGSFLVAGEHYKWGSVTLPEWISNVIHPYGWEPIANVFLHKQILILYVQ